QLSQDARTRSSAGVATARHDLGIDRAVCGAVLHAGADRRLHRDRAGRRSGHGARSLAAARALRRGGRRVFGAAVRPRPWPAVRTLAAVLAVEQLDAAASRSRCAPCADSTAPENDVARIAWSCSTI